MTRKFKSQPRIKGIVRISKSSSMHPDIKKGLENLAKSENKSFSWVVNEIVNDYFGFDILMNKKTIKFRKIG